MKASFLLPEQMVRQDGTGPVMPLGDDGAQAVTVTLGITRIIEQESLDLTIWGSADGENFGDKPIASYPQKFYCGVYSLLVDLSDRPDVRYLRAQWKLNRWGRGEPTPLFCIYVFCEPADVPSFASAGAA